MSHAEQPITSAASAEIKLVFAAAHAIKLNSGVIFLISCHFVKPYYLSKLVLIYEQPLTQVKFQLLLLAKKNCVGWITKVR